MADAQQLTGAVVGGGAMGALHVRVLRSVPQVRQVVLVEPDAQRRAALEREHSGLRCHVDLDSALAAERLDFACVAVPVGAAPGVATTLIEAGIPVLLEKPMAPTIDEAEELAELAEKSGVLMSIGYVERFNPAVRALREELARGTCGTVYHVHARRLSPFPHRDGLAGVATDLATHDLDVMRFLTGSDPVRLYAETDRAHGHEGEDLLCASLRFENGVTGLIEANWLTPMKVRQLSVTTETGMFIVDYLTQDLFLHEQPQSELEWEAIGVMRGANEGRMIRYALERREPLLVEWESFVEAVVSGGPAPVPPADGVFALGAARAMVESGRTATPVAPAGFSRRNSR
ncbi:MAG: Gfo/Idh/MocA family oxidoreductase [Thermoleophilaceae bacterium]